MGGTCCCQEQPADAAHAEVIAGQADLSKETAGSAGAEEQEKLANPEDEEKIAPCKFVKVLDDGEQGTGEYRLRFKDSKDMDISPWHDIPLKTEQEDVFNCIIEIPKMTKKKMEVNTKEEMNPIAQDVKKGKLREYHGPIFWNYGMFPQTWEDPTVEQAELKVAGDNDPLDVVEIGSEALATGTVARVKVLGALAMIDDGELDWKVICIRVDDKMAQELDDIADVEAKCKGTISGIREWFRWYKTPDEKPLNAFGFHGKALNKAEALAVVAETHESWHKLCGSTDKGKLWVPSSGGSVAKEAMGA